MLGFVLVLLLALRGGERNVFDRLRSSGERAAWVLNRELGTLEDDLRATADALGERIDEPMAIRAVFRRTLDRQPSIFRLTLVDLEGRVVVERSRVFEPRDEETEAIELGALSHGELEASGVTFEEVDQVSVPFYRLVAPIAADDLEIVGALQAEIDLSALWSSITGLRVGERGRVYLVDSGNRLLVHHDLRTVQGSAPLTDLVGRSAQELNLPGLHLYDSIDGGWVVGTSVQLRGFPWYAVIEEPAVDALAPAILLAALLLTLILLLAVLVLSIVRFAQRRLVSPLAELRSGVERIGQGDLEHRIRIDSRDEVGALASEFNAMTAELAATIEDLHRRVGELRRAQDELRQARDNLERGVEERTSDLQAATQEMKSLLYMVSHDLRAPLINLHGFAGELRAALDGIRPVIGELEAHLDADSRRSLRQSFEDAPDSLEFIESSVLRLNDFTHALLRLSRAGHQELKIVRIDLHRLLTKILDTLAFQIEQCGARIDIGELPVIQADRLAIEQVFANLIGNAINYRAPDRTPEIHIVGECSNGEVRISVEDNGRGIAEEDFDKIFAPFRRIGSLDAEGEGVGLAYAQTLMRRHGGSIRCTSTFGVGSVFVVTLPVEVTVEANA